MHPILFNPNSMFGGGGGDSPCQCLHNNNTALIKQISLFDTALVLTNTQVSNVPLS